MPGSRWISNIKSILNFSGLKNGNDKYSVFAYKLINAVHMEKEALS